MEEKIIKLFYCMYGRAPSSEQLAFLLKEDDPLGEFKYEPSTFFKNVDGLALIYSEEMGVEEFTEIFFKVLGVDSSEAARNYLAKVSADLDCYSDIILEFIEQVENDWVNAKDENSSVFEYFSENPLVELVAVVKNALLQYEEYCLLSYALFGNDVVNVDVNEDLLLGEKSQSDYFWRMDDSEQDDEPSTDQPEIFPMGVEQEPF